MPAMNPLPNFDCLAYKHLAQAKIAEELENLAPQAQIAYLQTRVKASLLATWWQLLPSRTPKQPLKEV